jgi:hypothetical protein
VASAAIPAGSSGLLIFFFGFADLPGAEEGRPEDLDLDLVLDNFLHIHAEVACEEGVQVIGVAEQIGRRQDRPRGNLLRNILR